MRTREKLVFHLCIVFVLFVVAPAFAVLDGVKDVGGFATTYDGSTSPPTGTSYSASSGDADAAWSSDGSNLTISSTASNYWTQNTTALSTVAKWTVEFSVRLDDENTGIGTGAGFGVELRNGGDGTGIVVAKSKLLQRTGGGTYAEISATSNAEGTGFNAFRMAYDGTNMYVWRNGLDGGGWTVISSTLSARSVTEEDVLNFGDFANGSDTGVGADLDYIAFDLTGAYDVPEPATILLMLVGSLACLMGKRS